jgi:hypothetical protein
MSVLALMLRADDQLFIGGQADATLPIRLDAIAGQIAARIIGTEVRGFQVAVSHAQRLLESAAERDPMRARPRVDLPRIILALRRVGEDQRVEIHEVIAREAKVRAGVAGHQTQVQIVRDVVTELGGGGYIVIVIIDAPLAGCQHIRWRHRRLAGMKVIDVGCVMKLRERAAHSDRLVEGIEGARLRADIHLRRARAAPGDDVDHPADGVGTVQSALRTAQHLDTLDVGGEELAEVERAGGVARIAHIDAVDQYLGVVGIGAAHEHRGLAARSAALHHVEPGYLLQQVGQRLQLPRGNLLRGHHGDAARHLRFRRRYARGGHHDGVGRIVARRDGARRSGAQPVLQFGVRAGGD